MLISILILILIRSDIDRIYQTIQVHEEEIAKADTDADTITNKMGALQKEIKSLNKNRIDSDKEMYELRSKVMAMAIAITITITITLTITITITIAKTITIIITIITTITITIIITITNTITNTITITITITITNTITITIIKR